MSRQRFNTRIIVIDLFHQEIIVILICLVRIKICRNQMYPTIDISNIRFITKHPKQNTSIYESAQSRVRVLCLHHFWSGIRVTLRPLNAGITITSGQWMSQTQTKDMGHHRLRLRSVKTYLAYFCEMKAKIFECKYGSECIVWVGIFSSDLSAFISQAGQRDWARWESRIFLFSDGLSERESWELRRLTDGIHSSHTWTLGPLPTSGGVVGAVV